MPKDFDYSTQEGMYAAIRVIEEKESEVEYWKELAKKSFLMQSLTQDGSEAIIAELKADGWILGESGWERK